MGRSKKYNLLTFPYENVKCTSRNKSFNFLSSPKSQKVYSGSTFRLRNLNFGHIVAPTFLWKMPSYIFHSNE